MQSCSNQLSYSSYIDRVFCCGRDGTRTRDPVVMSEVTFSYGTCLFFKIKEARFEKACTRSLS